MSWQLAAVLVLGLALIAGFGWYERTRPDARVVALVGTLAAFAALGRIAFAAVPNVKPTSDIVLVSGYALGGGPGFAVGALAGLTSNFFFGQGPWTPWQMAAWGATGVLGAGLARVTRGRIGRWPLALVCCGAGFAFTAFQDVGDWVTYSDHSFAQLGVYVGQGLGFDAIHAAGCLAFALALGPVLIRSVHRFARRLDVEWVPAATAGTLLVALVAGLGTAASAPTAARAAADPTQYLLAAQNPDGGFGAAAGQASDPLFSGWATLGLASAGTAPVSIGRDGHSVLTYLTARARQAGDVGSVERTILVLAAAGSSVRNVDGDDLLAGLQRRERTDGSFANQVNLTAFGVMALRAAGVRAAVRAVAWLAAQQNRDGGFGYATAGTPSDADDTGAALEALAGAPGLRATQARDRAVGYLRATQDRDGGFEAAAGAGSNAQSTAWVVQGLDAVGVSPDSLHRHGAVSPVAYLRSLITSNGSVDYSRGVIETPVWVTGEALMALEGRPLPLVAVPHRTRALTTSSDGPVSGLAATVGFLTALALAPVQMG